MQDGRETFKEEENAESLEVVDDVKLIKIKMQWEPNCKISWRGKLKSECKRQGQKNQKHHTELTEKCQGRKKL